ncbi:hypothetical protein JCM8097_007381 [Rhodosporidiobolus ruineniae]
MTTTPPRSPSPSPSDSLASLRTALTSAHSASRLALLLSPDRTSTGTAGTGATGSTEEVGAATRSLVLSVNGRDGGGTEEWKEVVRSREGSEEPAVKPRLSGASSLSSVSTIDDDDGWDRALSLVGSPRMGAPLLQLPTPDPEVEPLESADESLPPVYDHHQEQEAQEGPLLTRVKLEDEDEALPFSPSPSPSPAQPADPEQPPLTDSQEASGLDRDVTRSQSDFNRWLEETVRLARGDGGSVIESDDALSSILLATRPPGSVADFGFANAEDGAPLSPVSEPGSFLFDAPALVDETLLFDDAEEEMEDGSTEEREEQVEEGKERTADETDSSSSTGSDTPSLPSSAAKTPSTLGWKLLTSFLSLALVYSLTREPIPLPHPLAEEEPTRSLQYVPINDSLVETSHFATPLPVGSALGLPAYALLVTAVVGVVAAVPLVKRTLSASSPSSSSITSSSNVDGARTRAASPLADLNAADLSLSLSLLATGRAHYAAHRLSLAANAFETVLPLACGAKTRARASEWLGRAVYRLSRVDRGGEDASERMRRAEAAFERAVRLDPASATARASLGRTRYRLADFSGAVSALRAAVKRDDTLAFAHEWLAKSLAAAEPRAKGVEREVERHLERAVRLDPGAASAHAFLGEWLCTTAAAVAPSSSTSSSSKKSSRSRLDRALFHLEQAVALRPAYPAAHARLAFLHSERLDAPSAASSWRAVLRARYRADAVEDECMSWQVREATEGAGAWKALVGCTPVGSDERRAVLEQAAKDEDGEADDLLAVLLAVSTGKPALARQLATLERRAERYGVEEDLAAHGLLAVALVAAGEGVRAEEVFGRFSAGVVERRKERASAVVPSLDVDENGQEKHTREKQAREEDREAAFVAMAYWEQKPVREEELAEAKRGKERAGREEEEEEEEMTETEVEEEEEEEGARTPTPTPPRRKLRSRTVSPVKQERPMVSSSSSPSKAKKQLPTPAKAVPEVKPASPLVKDKVKKEKRVEEVKKEEEAEAVVLRRSPRRVAAAKKEEKV